MSADSAHGVTRRFLPAILALALAPAASAYPTSAYFTDSTQAVAELKDWDVQDGDFTASIHRKFGTVLEQKLLAIAEATYPPRDEVIDVAIRMNADMGGDSARVPLWWCDGRGVGRVPYAVTAGAINHYVWLTKRFRSHNFWEAWDHNLFWSDLVYNATIEHRDEYFYEGSTVNDVYVAEMTLTWGYDDGVFVPMSVAHRVVILSPQGRVLAVSGDGDTREKVFFSAHRAPGQKDWIAR